jgi:hypothetical protein
MLQRFVVVGTAGFRKVSNVIKFVTSGFLPLFSGEKGVFVENCADLGKCRF